MMDGTFVTALKDAIAVPMAFEDRVIAPPGWKNIERPREPEPDALVLSTLTGIRDYLAANVDSLDLSKLILNVSSELMVRLYGDLVNVEDGQAFVRYEYVRANAPSLRFALNEYLPAEEFVIGLSTMFVANPARIHLQKLVASIRDSAVTETLDDGNAQEVKTARGVALVDRTPVQSAWTLAPYRTFREVEQPASEFVLRLRSGNPDSGNKPRCALFEADGGAWRLEAIESIAGWLKDAGSGVAIVA